MTLKSPVAGTEDNVAMYSQATTMSTVGEVMTWALSALEASSQTADQVVTFRSRARAL